MRRSERSSSPNIFYVENNFSKKDSKRLIYRNYKNLNNEYFQNNLKSGLTKCSKDYESFENVFVTVLDRHASRKTKTLRGNQKLHVDKNLRKTIMERSELKSKANKTKRYFRLQEATKSCSQIKQREKNWVF